MPGVTTIRYARSIYKAQSLAEDASGNIKEFRAHVNLAMRIFESIKTAFFAWRDQVRCGEIDLDCGQEEDFKAAFHAFTDLARILIEKFDLFHKAVSDRAREPGKQAPDGVRGQFLTNPRYITLLEDYKKEAKKTLASWQSPEWETSNERTVKWDKEQTRHLRAKLG